MNYFQMILKTLNIKKMSIKISVIMASHLHEYDFSAKDRIRKFHRAVHSFLNQPYQNKELVIVSDGCDLTSNEVMNHYKDNPLIKHVQIEKQPVFSGNVRNVGCIISTGDIICYLDSDDMLGKSHLQSIANGFNYYTDADWLYFNDYVIYGFNPVSNEILTQAQRDVDLTNGTTGTSSIAHKRLPEITWNGFDGYGHDFAFIKKNLIDSNKKFYKIDGTEYFVCHIPNSVDS